MFETTTRSTSNSANQNFDIFKVQKLQFILQFDIKRTAYETFIMNHTAMFISIRQHHVIISLAMDFLIDGQLCHHFFFWQVDSMRLELGTQITSQGWIVPNFLTMIFYNLKNSHQDLSNEGSNFILSSLKVGHWVAQT